VVEKMKVLIITPRYPPAFHGGGEISVKLLAENLKKNNIDVTVLSFDGNKEEIINNVNIIRKALPFRGALFKKLSMMFFQHILVAASVWAGSKLTSLTTSTTKNTAQVHWWIIRRSRG